MRSVSSTKESLLTLWKRNQHSGGREMVSGIGGNSVIIVAVTAGEY